MAFGLTIGTERATALQQGIQDELMRRGYSPDADPVMAEYITIMVINNKTSSQITTELEDLIGSDFDPSFTEWLFLEASKGVIEADESQQPEPSTSELPPREASPHVPAEASPHVPVEVSRRQPQQPRNNVYQQALSQALPNPTTSGQKRAASARSPSPSHPNKSRRTDLPTGPRAMTRNDGGANSRSLIDRIGGQNAPGRNPSAPNGYAHDDIQSRIDNIVNSSPEQNMMMAGGFPGLGGAGMDMSAMAGMGNPMAFQEILMNQMALMAQMTTMMNGGAGQFVGPGGFPMQGMPGDMGLYPGSMNGFQVQGQGLINGNEMNGRGRGRGGSRGGRGGPTRGRGGSTTATVSTSASKAPESTPQMDTPASHAIPIVAPAPITLNAITPSSSAPQRLGYAIPERPQSPTLCKFSTKCTNAQCRWVHPSPVATAESGVVLSNEACEKGKDCKDKDCIKAHVSPAVLNPQPLEHITPTAAPQAHANSPVSCRFGAACTRPGCSFSHPTRPGANTTQCRFGAACTRAGCPFVHPEGRVLPSTFHRGLGTTGPMVTVSTPETGSMGGSASHHRSVTFNKPVGPGQGVKEKLQQQVKEIEQMKLEAEKAVREAEAAAGKKEDTKPVAIAA
ncbi:hypothetical protein C0991_009091 [Blastosporella zonata]|nr:hypothetical protein C0991_009091 [Blastosporella zonata]